MKQTLNNSTCSANNHQVQQISSLCIHAQMDKNVLQETNEILDQTFISTLVSELFSFMYVDGGQQLPPGGKAPVSVMAFEMMILFD